MLRTLFLALWVSTFLTTSEWATLKTTGSVVSGKTKLKCGFSLTYTTQAVDLKKNKISCKPKNKKPVKIPVHEIQYFINEDTLCVFILSMTITKGKGKLERASIKCRELTTQKPPPTPPPTPSPTPQPTPPTPSSPSTCCKERIFDQSKYVLVGEEESLPICGNDCIYRREAEGNDGQLYCFPTRYIESQNQCDFKSNAPKPLVGFSSWSEWTRCQGGCGKGRSTRGRRCTADISDDLSCYGPTKQVRNCETSCEAESPPCPIEQLDVNHPKFACSYHFVPGSKDWDEAQEECQETFGGKLWEPTSKEEYHTIMSFATSQTNNAVLNCPWWIGLFNWSNDTGSPYNLDTYLSSTVTNPPTSPGWHNEPIPKNGVISSFIQIPDGGSGEYQNCVYTFPMLMQDFNDNYCWWKMNFICQSCPPCSCTYNNVSYPCGSLIKRNLHCCSETVCNYKGMIEDIQVHSDKNGKPESGCCMWRGQMVTDGAEFGPFWIRHVCCKGEVLRKKWWWPSNPFPIPTEKSCPPSWHKQGQSCYLYNDNYHDWVTAENICQEEGAHLVSIETEKENRFVWKDIGVDTHVLIGARASQEGIWAWPNGAPLKYSAWQCDPALCSKRVRCAYMDINTGLWVQQDCDVKTAFVCKKVLKQEDSVDE